MISADILWVAVPIVWSAIIISWNNPKDPNGGWDMVLLLLAVIWLTYMAGLLT